MARNVFKFNEIPAIEDKVVLKAPFEPADQEDQELVRQREEKRRVDEYTGPTVEDIQREVAKYKNDFEIEKTTMMKNAKEEADIVYEEAKTKAKQIVDDARKEASTIVDEGRDLANQEMTDARKKIIEEKAEVQRELDELVGSAKSTGYQEGYEAGFAKGQEEVDRLISKIHIIIGAVAEKRKAILEQSEAQIIDLVLNIANRVVKSISETQKDVVLKNISSALSKIKSRTDIIIRVNMSDLELATSKMKEFQASVEKVKNISIIEDATIEPGGCVVETDFGHIDARISSQLREIEDKIRQIAPVKMVESL